VDELGDFERIIVELKVAQRYNTVRKERKRSNMSFEIFCYSGVQTPISL
jgi:hypothetical protein